MTRSCHHTRDSHATWLSHLISMWIALTRFFRPWILSATQRRSNYPGCNWARSASFGLKGSPMDRIRSTFSYEVSGKFLPLNLLYYKPTCSPYNTKRKRAQPNWPVHNFTIVLILIFIRCRTIVGLLRCAPVTRIYRELLVEREKNLEGGRAY